MGAIAQIMPVKDSDSQDVPKKLKDRLNGQDPITLTSTDVTNLIEEASKIKKMPKICTRVPKL